ncbi:MAG: hypothetical protein WCT23_03080 [Candidatus Neomarinimicrobiota bacterium]
MLGKNTYIRATVLLLLTSCLFSMQLFVPIDDAVYPYLERQATRGFIPEFLNDSKPLQRDEVAFWLVKLHDFEKKMHRVDRNLLEDFLGEYRVELGRGKHPDLSESDSRLGIGSWKNFKEDMHCLFVCDTYEEEKHIYLHESENTIFWINSDFTFIGEGKNNIVRFIDRLGAEASMQLGKHVSLFVDGYFFHHFLPDEWREISDEFAGYWINDYAVKNFATFDRSEAYMNVSGDFGTFTLAHYPIVWGSGLHSLILAEEAIPFGSLRWIKTFKNFKYSFVHGTLLANNYTWTEAEGKHYPPKYLVGHNIEIKFTPRFHATFTEMIVYGNRLPEPSYLVPSIFLWPTEHALSDRDNKMIQLGAEIFPLNGLRVYGNVLLDELVFGKIFKDFWANKYALQGGFQWSPRSLPMDVITELTAVHPWTYAHKYEFTSYTHHGKDLGFFMGPNTRFLTSRINYDLSVKNKLIFAYHQCWEGADVLNDGVRDYPIGGDSNQNYEERNRDLDNATTWLMGDIQIERSFGLAWEHRLRNQIEIRTSCELREINDQFDVYYSLGINTRY